MAALLFSCFTICLPITFRPDFFRYHTGLCQFVKLRTINFSISILNIISFQPGIFTFEKVLFPLFLFIGHDDMEVGKTLPVCVFFVTQSQEKNR